jgi:hypothetical protein
VHNSSAFLANYHNVLILDRENRFSISTLYNYIYIYIYNCYIILYSTLYYIVVYYIICTLTLENIPIRLFNRYYEDVSINPNISGKYESTEDSMAGGPHQKRLPTPDYHVNTTSTSYLVIHLLQLASNAEYCFPLRLH